MNIGSYSDLPYICGNPPYLGAKKQTKEQKADLQAIFIGRVGSWKSLDYVAGWFMKAADYGTHTDAVAAFVTTNSVSQGVVVPILWPAIFETGHEINFAHTSFKWANLASHNAGVTVVIVGISRNCTTSRKLYGLDFEGSTFAKSVTNINPYLAPGANVLVENIRAPMCDLPEMVRGNMAVDGGHLIMTINEVKELGLSTEQHQRFVRPFLGSAEFIRGAIRYCLWIEDEYLNDAQAIPSISSRIESVREMRLGSANTATIADAKNPHRFSQVRQAGHKQALIVPRVSSESREYLPVGALGSYQIVNDNAYAIYDAPLWSLALIASRIHIAWIAAVCGKMKTDYRYSSNLGWNTFPVPTLTEKNKADLTRCAENILLAREAHFPATIADLYDPEKMPDNLREAHERNDEVLERIYIGRRFKNDTERLEKLFELYTKMTADSESKSKPKRRAS